MKMKLLKNKKMFAANIFSIGTYLYMHPKLQQILRRGLARVMSLLVLYVDPYGNAF